MLAINSLEDIAALRESVDLECKLAQGRDGKGELPKSIWETYSAFANTRGGDIFLGLKENKQGAFELAGIENTQKVLDNFWTTINNVTKVNVCVVRERWVNVLVIDGKNVIHIHVPQAARKDRPVFIDGNPLKGAYKRFNSADIVLDEEAVRRLLAEQVEDSRDTQIIKGYGFDDLHLESFNAYRNMYSARQPDHPWNKVDAQEFLYKIGAWGKDRETGATGLTRAGLLMFGDYRPIKEAFPNYMVDYQERPEAKTEARWIDRIVPDGSWSGNLFDFYGKVIRKLTADLKVPFVLEGDQRQDDTLVHKALREALVNTLIHADYTGRTSVLIVKRPDMFGFRNPGAMRIPIEAAKRGGDSDCRNRNLQDMFRFIGLGENAGSGLQKIFTGWDSQHWRSPLLREKSEPTEQTLLELHTLSLVPEKVLEQLRDELGAEVFDRVSEKERLILVTASIEKTVDHARMMEVLAIHPRDLSALLASLVEKKLLYQNGSGRGTVYFLAAARLDDAYKAFEQSQQRTTEELAPALGDSSGGLGASSGGLPSLKALGEVVAEKKRAPKSLVENTILTLCARQPCSLELLAELLNRSTDVIRKDYLQPMVRDRRLSYQYPTIPNHPEQAYITVGSPAYKEST